MQQLHSIQNSINKLLILFFNGSYLSNRSKFFYPFLKAVHDDINQDILILKRTLCTHCNVKSSESLYQVLADSVKWFNSRVNSKPPDRRSEKINILKIYNKEDYWGAKFKPINRLFGYIEKKLDPYLIDAYIHGSLSTKDYTEYSDLDTLFIIKNDVLEDAEGIKELEKLFIGSQRYLYEFDPLQHHGHFFLIESDLKSYDQSILPLSAIKLSTSILGRGTSLKFYIRNSEQESEHRFLKSIRIIRRYIRDGNRLKTPYYLKGFLSRFMILPVLFLQLRGEYVSKKDSFEILKKRVPAKIWHCMEQVSSIRQDWNQDSSSGIGRMMKLVGAFNPLLLPFFATHFRKTYPVINEIINKHFLDEMDNFTEYLLMLSGLDESSRGLSLNEDCPLSS